MLHMTQAERTGEEDRQGSEGHSPDDFCRTCRGTKVLRDQEYRHGEGTVWVAMDCWACNGTGYGT